MNDQPEDFTLHPLVIQMQFSSFFPVSFQTLIPPIHSIVVPADQTSKAAQEKGYVFITNKDKIYPYPPLGIMINYPNRIAKKYN